MFSKKIVDVGNILIGGSNPISIQSMTNTDTLDSNATIVQINELAAEGADIIRVSVRSLEDIPSFKNICKNVSVPIVADIHFDYRVAIESIKAGAKKIRLNPGNIGETWKIEEVVKVAKEYSIPIRVGANSGSIKKDFLNLNREEALAESALEEVRILEKMDFDKIIISLKSSDAIETYKANKYLAEKIDYPLHIGITEAGVYEDSIMLSSAGIGAMLLNNIGDTIRISISGNPVTEITAAKKLLTLLGFRNGLRIISCPTCARTEIDIEGLVYDVKKWTKNISKNITIAIMGCVVNGPGEARHADLALAGTKYGAAFYKKGELLKNVEKTNIREELMKILNEM